MKLHRPLDGNILVLRKNKKLHGRSVYRSKDVPGHNVVHGYNKPGTGDALDLFTCAGMPVYAMHDGRVLHVGERAGKLACVYLVGGDYFTVYAHLHIRDEVVVGAEIERGQVIGYVGKKVSDPHLHLEVWKDETALSGTTARMLAAKIKNEIELE